jgi:hypothetical protein
LGIQVENRTELAEVYERLRRADRPVLEEVKTVCCYAQSEKSWIEDPQGVRWETFLTTGDSSVYGSDTAQEAETSRCCAPTVERPGAGTCCAAQEHAQAADAAAACCG